MQTEREKARLRQTCRQKEKKMIGEKEVLRHKGRGKR